MTIAVVRTVPSHTSRSMASVRRRRHAVMASAPMMPTAADSVAVARPKKIAPTTISEQHERRKQVGQRAPARLPARS